MTTAKLEMPPKLIPVFTGSARYRGAYGGRGSGKTRTFALMTAVRGMMFAEAGISGNILCAREFMNSLEDSSMEEIKQAIRSVPWLNAYYDIGERYIRSKNRRINYTFVGLRHNLDSIKSKARLLIAWIDEAEGVSEVAYQKLLPTVRGDDNAEVWITWNPELDGSPTDVRFRKHTPESSKIVELSYSENPWFPEVLDLERRSDYERLDPQTYAWVWEGAYRENSDAQVFSGKYKIGEFTPDEDKWHGPYNGLDFGFAQDPTAAVVCWVHDDRLWIEHEAGKVGLDIDDTARFVDQRIPGFGKSVIRADSARPESISYLKRHGMPFAEGVAKWTGSVEDGITHLRSYREIVVHPRCKEVLKEMRLYSYKVDRLTGDITTKIVDANNHYIDAIRYALNPMIQGKGRMKISAQTLALAAQRR